MIVAQPEYTCGKGLLMFLVLIAKDDQYETERYWNAMMPNGTNWPHDSTV